MLTTNEVEAQLRRSLRAVADTTPVEAEWETVGELLEANREVLTTLRPSDRFSQKVRRRPAMVLVTAFVTVLVGVGVLALLGGGGGGSGPAGPISSHPLDDSLRYVPTVLPEYAPALEGWFTDGHGFVEAQPERVFIEWADDRTRALSGLVIWPSVDEDLNGEDIGAERDDEGFWVREYEEAPWLRIRGETTDGQFLIDGTGDYDRELVFKVARSIRDGQPLPDGVQDLVDVTPPEEAYLNTPIERNWYVYGERMGEPDEAGHLHPDVQLNAAVHTAYVTLEPTVQLAMFPWSCELIELDTGNATLCEPGEWRVVWKPTPDVAITLDTLGFERGDVIEMADSMELMSALDPRLPPPPGL